MNSRLKMLSGSIVSIVGVAVLVGAKIAESEIPWYQRVDDFDTIVSVLSLVGIMLIIWGAIDIIGGLISSAYSNKTIESIETQQVQTIICPGCGLRLNKSTKACPKCGTEIQ